MIAIDTNVLGRRIMQDDERQYRRVYELLEQTMVPVELAVLLEADWVHWDGYEFAKDDVVAAFEREVLALSAARAGFSLADALHWAATAAAPFTTFDHKFVGRALSANSNHPIVEDIQSLVA